MAPDYDAALLRTLFTQSPSGLHILDPELRVVRYNTAAPGMHGVDPETVIGRDWRSLSLATDALEHVLRGVLDTGEPVTDFTYHVGLPTGGALPRTLSVSAFRLEDPAGGGRDPVGLAFTAVDITERARAQWRLEMVHRAGEQIGTTLDVGRTAQEFTDVLASGLADVAVVDILDSVLHGEAPAPGPVYDRVTVRRVAFRAAAGKHLHPVHELGGVRVLRYHTPHSRTLGDLRLRSGPLTPDDAWLAGDDPHAEAVRASGAHSLVVLPLTARGVVLGVVTLYRTAGSPAFDESDVGLASDLTRHAATSIDNARHYTREHALAQLTQRNLVPARLPEHSAVETAYAYLPVTSSGVWFDVIALSGSRVALVAGDVSGSGMRTVTTMGRLRTVLSALATMDLTPEELLERLHEQTAQLAREYPSGAEESAELTATCLYAVYDPVSRVCVLASAGHPMPVIALPDGHVAIIERPEGSVLGRGLPRYDATRVTLPEGSVLALRSTALLGGDTTRPLELYRDVLGRPAPRLRDACDDLFNALLPEEPSDDAMLLLARTRVLGPDRVASWELPGRPESAARARRLVRDQLTEWGLDDLDFGTGLIASELVTNAIRYSAGPVELRLIRDATLICEVSDVNTAAPLLRHAEEDDEGGRGLYLVAQVTQRWGMRHGVGGKTIWTEQPVP